MELVFVLFATEFIFLVVVFLLLYLCSCIEAPLCTTMFFIVEHMFKKNFDCLMKFV